MTAPLPTKDDYLSGYQALRERLANLARGADTGSWVPSCPGWRVHDVLAHLTGLCDDWVNHRIDGYATPQWTASQVQRYSSSTVDAVLDRWAELADAFALLDDDLVMGPPARWAFGDAVTHEADIRGALSAGRVPGDAVRLGLAGTMQRWQLVLRDAHTPPLIVRPPEGDEWNLGKPDDPAAVIVQPPIYELFRALAGRRSSKQVREWSWSADPEPFIAAGLPFPFERTSTTIVD
jgi:uncharacterized protein (TIGR03083 family)